MLALLITPLIIPAPIAAFILWDSLGHWRTTALTFTEYYYLPLVLLLYYLLIAYAIAITAFLVLTLFARYQWKKEMKMKPQQGVAGYGAQMCAKPER